VPLIFPRFCPRIFECRHLAYYTNEGGARKFAFYIQFDATRKPLKRLWKIEVPMNTPLKQGVNEMGRGVANTFVCTGHLARVRDFSFRATRAGRMMGRRGSALPTLNR